jgi:hypothetical protein
MFDMMMELTMLKINKLMKLLLSNITIIELAIWISNVLVSILVFNVERQITFMTIVERRKKLISE